MGLGVWKAWVTSGSHICVTWACSVISLSLRFHMHNRNNKTYFPDSCEDYIPDLAYSKNSINLIYYDDE